MDNIVDKLFQPCWVINVNYEQDRGVIRSIKSSINCEKSIKLNLLYRIFLKTIQQHILCFLDEI